MTPVSSLHYGILQQANHTDSEYLNELKVPQRDYYLNKSKDIIKEWLAIQDEANDTIRRHLDELVIRGKKLEYTRTGNVYIAKYPDNFYKQKALYALASITGCELVKRITIQRPTSEKFQRVSENANTRRIWDFQRTYAQEAFDGIHVLSEQDVNLEIYLDYIRDIPDVAYPSGTTSGAYIGPSGEHVKDDKNLDVDSVFFKQAVIDLAVLEIKRDYSKIPEQEYRAQRAFILSTERI